MTTPARFARRVLLATLFLATPAIAAEESLSSPDGKITVTVSDVGGLCYRVSFDGNPALADSILGLDFKDGFSLGPKAALQKAVRSSGDTTWENQFGKRCMVRDHFNELRLELAEAGEPARRFGLVVRAYDDGVAFRYDLPQQPALDAFVITNERTEFAFTGDYRCRAGEFSSCAESRYPEQRLTQIAAPTGFNKGRQPYVLPALVELPQGFAVITESDLLDWAGMFLDGVKDRPTLKVALAQRADKQGCVVSQTPRLSPWRVVMLGRRPGDLIVSNLINNLATPSQIDDVSWIKPGITAWDTWWAKSVRARGTTETHKAYIDFAGEMGWPYQLIDWGWYEKNDVTQWNSSVNVPELIEYAKIRNVKELVWMHSKDLKETGVEKAFSTVAGWGVSGVKIDFMNSDSQEAVKWYCDTLEAAAKHHLIVDFHGAYKPTGLARTWPNYITQEGVLGNEYNKLKDNKITPKHTLSLVFTRGLLGPMDFTPGGFHNRTPQDFVMDAGAQPGGNCQVMGTRARQLAMTVIYESPLLCLCDSPESYRNQPGVDFLRGLPTVWDETVVPSAEMDKHVVIARRNGDRWFLAAMNGDEPVTLTVPLTYLANGKWNLRRFADTAESSTKPESIEEKTELVNSGETITLHLASGGGYAAILSPVVPSPPAK